MRMYCQKNHFWVYVKIMNSLQPYLDDILLPQDEVGLSGHLQVLSNSSRLIFHFAFYSLPHLICSCLLFILNTKGFVPSKKPLFCALRLSVNIWKFSERDYF